MSQKKQIIIIDNHDSFTYNLYQLFDEHPDCDVTVVQNDQINLDAISSFDQIVFSPGPDIPQKSPIMYQVLEKYKETKPILGICLGHQAIGDYFGATLFNLPDVLHGQQRSLCILDSGELLFRGVANNSTVGLYHSWALAAESIPPELIVTAVSTDGIIMGIRHQEYNIRGIQFHPESFMTEQGAMMIKNWIEQ
ncbi:MULTISPECIES: anthranilate synthase component II [Myroides]|uniref:Anthranilate synthase component II n=1 Tax=Myroides albus TaxID=2562892 RepID=A0A6I3LM28_9FLAO|nr:MULTISPECIES: aminodeoxychorismate/anthranilate synthase component II [Myroides]MTG98747.1 anthranilate synthase component II [Myroides albus]MVX36605.1 anthranilate synthase component II [Myroides sp. LoEW2-1]UVD79935.1 aminodeoxychorismate/anthranilate synthase component II [Myroides albus]